jgi:hypothetical protein
MCVLHLVFHAALSNFALHDMTFSSQFDPAPRDESWHKSPRTPDYFL